MSRVILFVDDVKKTTDFYEKIIGLKILDDSDKGFIILDAGGCQLCLHQIPSEWLDSSNKYEAREDSNTKIVFYSSNVESDRADSKSQPWDRLAFSKQLSSVQDN